MSGQLGLCEEAGGRQPSQLLALIFQVFRFTRFCIIGLWDLRFRVSSYKQAFG